MESFETMLMEVRKFEARNGIEVVLMESLPRSSDKPTVDADERAELTAHLAAALGGNVLLGAKRPLSAVKLDETKPAAKIVIPEGVHVKLAEAFGSPVTPVGEDQHKKLARALEL